MNAALAIAATDTAPDAESVATHALPQAAEPATVVAANEPDNNQGSHQDKLAELAISSVVSPLHLPLEQLISLTEAAQRNGQTEQALQLYHQWTQESNHPQRHLALFNYGSMLQSLGNHPLAVDIYRQCLAIAPGFARSGINLGLALENLGRSDEALQCWSHIVSARFVQADSDAALVVTALNHIGRLQETLKRYELSEAALEQSLQLDPNQPGVIQHWIHIRQKACRWPVYTALPRVNMNKMLMSTSPLAQLAVDDDPLKQLLVASSFVERTYSFKQEYLSRGRQYRHERLRLGYVSGDLCTHAVGLLLAEFFEAHDRSKFELFAYDFSIEDGTAQRQRLKSAFEHVRAIHRLTDRQVAEVVLHDEIDILIDLHGASSGARPGIFALHPAPLQGTYLGFIGTTGMPWFDFVVADRYVLPESITPYFTETPLYVDGSFLPLTSHRAEPRLSSRAALGLPQDGFVMASFGNIYKINEALFKTWLEILREVPQATLWLINDNSLATHNLRSYAQQSGINPARIVFTPRVAHEEFRGQLRLADVFLDTFPYNCGSTTNDVIEAGTPMVTLSGNSMVSRMGGSILKSLGRDQTIANSFEQYKQMTIALAQSHARNQAESGTTEHQRNRIDPQQIVQARTRMLRSLEDGLLQLQRQKSTG